MKLFVYGTLKKGYQNEPLIRGEEYLGRCVLAEPRFRLYEVNGCYPFPALVEDTNGYQVYGELYDVQDACLPMLDHLEGVAQNLYSRIFVKVLLEDGRLLNEVLAYRYERNTSGETHVGPVWPMKELWRYRLTGKRLQSRTETVTRPVKKLWSERLDSPVTPGFEDENELIKYCRPRRKTFGAISEGSCWNEKHFEIRAVDDEIEIEQWRIVDGETESPPFERFAEVAAWAAENLTFFGGETAKEGVWAEALMEMR